jgi:hypothetical protein
VFFVFYQVSSSLYDFACTLMRWLKVTKASACEIRQFIVDDAGQAAVFFVRHFMLSGTRAVGMGSASKMLRYTVLSRRSSSPSVLQVFTFAVQGMEAVFAQPSFSARSSFSVGEPTKRKAK